MTLVLYVFVIFLVYSILPTIVYEFLHIGVYQKGTSGHQVSFTFDDGPDPKYTPMLLDLLKKYHVKATFFVVGENAKNNPELIKRIHDEGHLVGLHHYKHLSNWFLLPSQTKKQCDMAADVVEEIIGERPIYYRPPWGHLHLFILFIRKYYHIVIWSAILGDWNTKLGKDKLFRRIEKNLYGGAVICLHDRGTNIGADKDAPAMTIAALNEILDKYQHAFDYVTVEDMYHGSSQVNVPNPKL